MDIARCIDHTLLKPDATDEQIEALCLEAREHGFYSVCINTCHAQRAKALLTDSGVHLCCVVGFPLGACSTESKAFEAMQAVERGADEIDMVLNLGALKSDRLHDVMVDILAVIAAVQGRAKVKVILETGLLSDREKQVACVIARECGADFVKTSTGFAQGGATVHDVELLKRSFGGMVKASGGIRDYETAMQMLNAGADRIGTSSGVAIVSAAPHSSDAQPPD